MGLAKIQICFEHLHSLIRVFDVNTTKFLATHCGLVKTIIRLNWVFVGTCELPHDKTTKWHVHQAKPQISPVWSESLLCAQWIAKDPKLLHVDSEDSDQTGRMPRLIWVFTGHTCHFVGFCHEVAFLLFRLGDADGGLHFLGQKMGGGQSHYFTGYQTV